MCLGEGEGGFPAPTIIPQARDLPMSPWIPGQAALTQSVSPTRGPPTAFSHHHQATFHPSPPPLLTTLPPTPPPHPLYSHFPQTRLRRNRRLGGPRHRRPTRRPTLTPPPFFLLTLYPPTPHPPKDCPTAPTPAFSPIPSHPPFPPRLAYAAMDAWAGRAIANRLANPPPSGMKGKGIPTSSLSLPHLLRIPTSLPCPILLPHLFRPPSHIQARLRRNGRLGGPHRCRQARQPAPLQYTGRGHPPHPLSPFPTFSLFHLLPPLQPTTLSVPLPPHTHTGSPMPP